MSPSTYLSLHAFGCMALAVLATLLLWFVLAPLAGERTAAGIIAALQVIVFLAMLVRSLRRRK